MITWRQYQENQIPAEELQPLLDWLNKKPETLEQPYPSIAVQLPDFWWFMRRHHYGRSGHGWVCPFSLTMVLWIERLKGNTAVWVADCPVWLEHDSDLYEPAVPIVIQKNGVRCSAYRQWTRYTSPIENTFDHWFNQFNFLLHQRIGKTIGRKPLGTPVDNSYWRQEFQINAGAK